MPLKKKDIVDFGRAGLIFDVVLETNGSFSVEVQLPVSNVPSRKHTVTPVEESHKLLTFLTNLSEPNIVFSMLKLADDKSSRLYKIPKELYDEDTK